MKTGKAQVVPLSVRSLDIHSEARTRIHARRLVFRRVASWDNARRQSGKEPVAWIAGDGGVHGSGAGSARCLARQ